MRHEYVAGEIYAMTGATRRHHDLRQHPAQARGRGGGRPCRVSVETVRLEVVGKDTSTSVAYYPT